MVYNHCVQLRPFKLFTLIQATRGLTRIARWDQTLGKIVKWSSPNNKIKLRLSKVILDQIAEKIKILHFRILFKKFWITKTRSIENYLHFTSAENYYHRLKTDLLPSSYTGSVKQAVAILRKITYPHMHKPNIKFIWFQIIILYFIN